MLGKLMKYELKSLSRAFIPMWILAPIIALMLSLSIRGMVAWSDSPIFVLCFSKEEPPRHDSFP